MDFPILKPDDSLHPSHDQQCGEWNTVQLLLCASYQMQTQTGTVWLHRSWDLFTYFTAKHQVTSELWQQPAGSLHASGAASVPEEHWAQMILGSDSGSLRILGKFWKTQFWPESPSFSYCMVEGCLRKHWWWNLGQWAWEAVPLAPWVSYSVAYHVLTNNVTLVSPARFLYLQSTYKGWENGSLPSASIGTWVWIPSTYVNIWAWLNTPVSWHWEMSQSDSGSILASQPH